MGALLKRALDLGIESQYARQLIEERGFDNAATLTICCLGTFKVEVDGQLLTEECWKVGGAAPQRMQRMLLYLARNRTHSLWKRLHVLCGPTKQI